MVRDGALLVFRHRDQPDAGLQVPAGTLEPGESPDVGVIREAEEETGRRGFTVARKLGTQEFVFVAGGLVPDDHRHQLRHVFELRPPEGLPERWSHFAEEVTGGYWFEFSWAPLDRSVDLAGGQGELLAKLR